MLNSSSPQFSPMASPPAAAAAQTASYAHFSWSIDNFSKLSTEELYSRVFYVGRSKWRIIILPGGYKTNQYLSVFMDVADSDTLPLGWNREAQFCLAVINPLDYKSSVREAFSHRFVEGKSSWGSNEFMRLSDLNDPGKGYLLNDTLSVEVDITVRSVVEYSLEEEVPYVEGSKNCKTGEGGFEEEASHATEASVPAIPSDDVCTIHQDGHNVSSDQISAPDIVEKAIQLDAAPAATSAGKMADSAPAAETIVQFLTYHVSSEASLVLEKIHDLHKNTFTEFSMKAPILQTALLESFTSFIQTMSTTKVSEMNEEALCVAALSVKDFQQVGLDLSWLNQRLDEAKMVVKHSQSLDTIDSYVKALEVAQAKVCELEDKIAKAKEEAENSGAECCCWLLFVCCCCCCCYLLLLLLPLLVWLLPPF